MQFQCPGARGPVLIGRIGAKMGGMGHHLVFDGGEGDVNVPVGGGCQGVGLATRNCRVQGGGECFGPGGPVRGSPWGRKGTPRRRSKSRRGQGWARGRGESTPGFDGTEGGDPDTPPPPERGGVPLLPPKRVFNLPIAPLSPPPPVRKHPVGTGYLSRRSP